MVLDAIATLSGLIIPPAFDFIKKKFIKSERDTADDTLQSLACTNPDKMMDFVNAQALLLKSQADFFNRDIVNKENISKWLVDLRGAIRPVVIILSLGFVVYCRIRGTELDEGTRIFIEGNISSWFGKKLC